MRHQPAQMNLRWWHTITKAGIRNLFDIMLRLMLLTCWPLGSIPLPLVPYGTGRKGSLWWRDDTLFLLHSHARHWAWHTNALALNTLLLLLLPFLLLSISISRCLWVLAFNVRRVVYVQYTACYISCLLICALQINGERKAEKPCRV